MSDGVQTDVARHFKAFAEQVTDDDIKFGFASQEGGAVVRAEPDLRMRVRSVELASDDDK